MNNLNRIGTNDKFIKQTKQYDKIDAFFTLILYLIMLTLFSLLGEFLIHNNSYNNIFLVFGGTGFISLILVGIVFLLCFIRKQKFHTIGLTKINFLKSLSFGLVVSLVFIIVYIIPLISSGSKIQVQTNSLLIIMNIIYYLIFIALPEEILYRGYFTSRLSGFINNKALSTLLVGIMFSLSHVPFQMILAKMNLINYITANISQLITYVIIHFIFQWMYSKYDNITAPVILHFIWDFTGWFIIK